MNYRSKWVYFLALALVLPCYAPAAERILDAHGAPMRSRRIMPNPLPRGPLRQIPPLNSSVVRPVSQGDSRAVAPVQSSHSNRRTPIPAHMSEATKWLKNEEFKDRIRGPDPTGHTLRDFSLLAGGGLMVPVGAGLVGIGLVPVGVPMMVGGAAMAIKGKSNLNKSAKWLSESSEPIQVNFNPAYGLLPRPGETPRFHLLDPGNGQPVSSPSHR